VKITRTVRVAGLLAAAGLVLAACGTDSNSSTTTTPAAATTSSAATSAANSASSSAMETSGSAGGGTTFEGAGFSCATGSLASSGSTAQGKAISKWIIDYNAKCSATLADYGGGGSGKGVSDFLAGQVDFAGSDSPLTDDQHAQAKSSRCKGNEALDLPMVVGPIALAYNLQGVDKLILTPELLTGIFGGTITTWNDPKIAAVNPGVTLPSLAVATVHRAEESGTTDNFTKYLTAAGGWTFPGGKAWSAPGGTAEQGNDGVGKAIASTAGSIGYVEWGFAKDNGLSMAQIDNGGGAVELTAETAGSAVNAAQVVGTGDDLTLKLDYTTKDPKAYPVILVTYEIVCSAGNGDKADLLKSFLGYTSTDGQGSLEGVGAAPLPAEIQTKVVAAVQKIAA
jgi:phosphate transport system substrate-binding protein